MPVALTLSEPRAAAFRRSGAHSREAAPIVEAADFYDLDGKDLEPGEQPMQSCLILERAVYHCLDRLDRGGDPVEVK